MNEVGREVATKNKRHCEVEKNQVVPTVIAYHRTIDHFCWVLPYVLSGLLATGVIADVRQGLVAQQEQKKRKAIFT